MIFCSDIFLKFWCLILTHNMSCEIVSLFFVSFVDLRLIITQYLIEEMSITFETQKDDKKHLMCGNLCFETFTYQPFTS